VANPSGLLLGSVLMLVHIGQPEAAARVHNAWLRTIEDGIHTYDIYKEGVSRQKVGTREFAQAVIARLGQSPEKLKPVAYTSAPPQSAAGPASGPRAAVRRETVGVDVYVGWKSPDSDALAAKLQPLAAPGFQLTMMTSRGVKVWPDGAPETLRVDECRCRFLAPGGGAVTHGEIVALLGRIATAGLEFVKTENLQTFDGEKGFSLGQGE
jgi:isocitrate dehydrogenase